MSFWTRLFADPERAARQERERRLAAFRDELAAARAADDVRAISALPARLAALGLDDDDAAVELEIVEGLQQVSDLQAARHRGEPLPVIPNSHRAIAGEVCHFVAPAARPDLADDPGGKVFFTPTRIVYIGLNALTMPWAQIADARTVDRDIVCTRRPDKLYAFRFNSHVDALRGGWIARQLADRPAPG